MNTNIAKIVSSVELKSVPVKKLNDPTTAIPALRIGDLTEPELIQKAFHLKECKLTAH